MFYSKSDESVPVVPLSRVPATRSAQTSAAPSIICADLVVHGTLTSTGDIQIDGRVEGDVRSARVVIGEKAVVVGEVVADDIVVRGSVQGSIRARRVHFHPTSRVEGDILHNTLAVNTGAQLNCNCRQVENPLAQEPVPKKVIGIRTQTASSGILTKSTVPAATAMRSAAQGLVNLEKAAAPAPPLSLAPASQITS